MEFIFELATPYTFTTSAISLGISCLDHKSLNNTMEDSVVVITIFRMHREILHRLWTLLKEKLDHNITHRCVDGSLFAQWVFCPYGCGHRGIFFSWLFIENITTVVCSALRRFTCGENEKTLLIIRSAYCKRIYGLF